MAKTIKEMKEAVVKMVKKEKKEEEKKVVGFNPDIPEGKQREYR